MQDTKECYLCGSRQWLEEHHIFGNVANRKLSEKFGMKVWLCHYCHNEPPAGVHFNKKNDIYLKQMAQTVFENEYSHGECMRVFGKNWL